MSIPQDSQLEKATGSPGDRVILDTTTAVTEHNGGPYPTVFITIVISRGHAMLIAKVHSVRRFLHKIFKKAE